MVCKSEFVELTFSTSIWPKLQIFKYCCNFKIKRSLEFAENSVTPHSSGFIGIQRNGKSFGFGVGGRKEAVCECEKMKRKRQEAKTSAGKSGFQGTCVVI